jgi:hypothetical protein
LTCCSYINVKPSDPTHPPIPTLPTYLPTPHHPTPPHPTRKKERPPPSSQVFSPT